MKLTERLGKEWIFFDGGMGTILQEHGVSGCMGGIIEINHSMDSSK